MKEIFHHQTLVSARVKMETVMSASSGVMVHMSLFLPGKKVTLASKVIKHPPSSQSSIQKTFGNTLSFSRSPHPTAMWETTSTPASSSQFHSRLWSGFLQLIQSLPECGRGAYRHLTGGGGRLQSTWHLLDLLGLHHVYCGVAGLGCFLDG